MKRGTVLILWLAQLVYTILGAIIFMHLEGGRQNDVNESNMPLNVTRYLEDRRNATGKDADLEWLVRDAIQTYKNGMLVLENANVNEPTTSWTFGASAFFSITVITTIGYGTLAPVTPSGRVACIFYAMFGIPLNFVLLGAIGRRINSFNRRLDRHVAARFPHPRVAQTVRFVITFFLGWTVFIQLPALAFSHLEGWTMCESVYMAFVSLSTIGFGDLTPEIYLYDARLARLLIVLWLVLGLAWLSTILSVIQEMISHKVLPPENRDKDMITMKRTGEKQRMIEGECEEKSERERVQHPPNSNIRTQWMA